jgi:hypothetical protein
MRSPLRLRYRQRSFHFKYSGNSGTPRAPKRIGRLSMLHLWQERREEYVGNAKTTRSRDFAEGRSSEDGGSRFERGFPALRKTHRTRGPLCTWTMRRSELNDGSADSAKWRISGMQFARERLPVQVRGSCTVDSINGYWACGFYM